MDVDAVVSAAQWAAVLAWACAAGFIGWYVWGLRSVMWCRRGRRGRPDGFAWHLVVVHDGAGDSAGRGSGSTSRDDLVACLSRLAATFPDATVWVVADPAGGDAAAADVHLACAHDPRWHQLGAGPPNADDTDLVARVRYQLDSTGVDGVDRDRVLVGLLDSTAELDVDAPVFLCGRDLFADPAIGAVQTAHRCGVPAGAPWRAGVITEILRRIQDIEARGPLAAAQLASRHTGTCALGGAGQFVRLSALDDLVERARPAHARAGGSRARTDVAGGPERRLLDDQALTTRLHAAGWATSYSMDAWVTVPTDDDLRAHLTRRRDWARSTMARAGDLTRLWRAGDAARRERLDLALRLLQPWCYLLGVIAVVALGLGVAGFVLLNLGPAMTFAVHGGLLAALALAAIAYGEFTLWGLAYGLRLEPGYGPIRGIATGLAHAVLGLGYAAAVWLAAVDLLRGSGLLPRPARRENHDDPSTVPMPAVPPRLTVGPRSSADTGRAGLAAGFETATMTAPIPTAAPAAATSTAAPMAAPAPPNAPRTTSAPLDEEYWQAAVLAQAGRVDTATTPGRPRTSVASRRASVPPHASGRREPERTQRPVSGAGRHRA